MALKSVSRAASILGSIRTAKKSASSRRNGRLGGRPPLPSCSARELLHRVREYCRVNNVHCVSELQAVALEMRDVWNHPPCPGFSVEDLAHSVEFPLDCRFLHRRAIAFLVPRHPLLL